MPYLFFISAILLLGIFGFFYAGGNKISFVRDEKSEKQRADDLIQFIYFFHRSGSCVGLHFEKGTWLPRVS